MPGYATLNATTIMKLCVKFTLFTSLALVFTGCQTTQEKPPEQKQAEILSSQLDIVRNHLDRAETVQALNAMKSLVRENPKNPDVQNLMGLTQLALKNSKRSIQHFRRAYRIAPTAAHALNLSSAYIEAGQPKRSIKLLRALLTKKQMVESYRFKERIFHNIGYSHVRLKQPKQAIRWFDEAVRENPAFFPSYAELGRIYQVQGNGPMAERNFRLATDYCPSCFDPAYALIMILLNAERPLEAQRAVDRFMRSKNLPEQEVKKGQGLKRLVAAHLRKQALRAAGKKRANTR